MVICLQRGANDLHMAQLSADATTTPSSLAALKFTLISDVGLKPNSITLAGLELAPNMFGASSELPQSWLRTS